MLNCFLNYCLKQNKCLHLLRHTTVKTIEMIKQDYLWKAAFRVFMQDFVRFFFLNQYDEIDWSKGIVFLDKELAKLQLKSNGKDRIAGLVVHVHTYDFGELA